MKRFLANFVAWAFVLFVLTFFLAGWVFAQGHWYRPVLVLALLLASFTCALFEQSDELEKLKKRLDVLEKGQAGAAEPPMENAFTAVPTRPVTPEQTPSDQEG